MKKIIEIKKEVADVKAKSAWRKGVKNYAIDLLDELADGFGNEYQFDNTVDLENGLLNGAINWNDYSYGGCALVYDEDIAKALCTPSELKKSKNARYNPNCRETWIDVQTRALKQAWLLIRNIAKEQI